MSKQSWLARRKAKRAMELEVREAGKADRVKRAKLREKMIMGGGDPRLDGDGTGWSGAITVDYWEARLANLKELAGWLGRPVIIGRDTPTPAQMEIARTLWNAREKR